MAKDSRLYAQFTLDFADSPKIAPLTDGAFRTLVEMTLYSRRMMSDGFVPANVAKKFWKAKNIRELLQNHDERPSLIEIENGYEIHDFAKHQMTSVDIEAKRAAGAAGGRAKARARNTASKNVAGATNPLEQKASRPLASTENREQSKSATEVALTAPRSADADFECFWSAYPRREAKQSARKAWDKAVKSVGAARIIVGAKRYRDDPNREPQFTAHAASWLNAGRWDDEPLPVRANGKPTQDENVAAWGSLKSDGWPRAVES